jgi:anti-sigma-K factor RskA
VTGHVLPFEGRSHRDVERLLPWYVNATLDAGERDLVRQHLADCAHCRSEVAALRALVGAGAEDTVEPDDARALDRDWSRLRVRLHAQRREASRSSVHRMRTGWRTSAKWMRVALAAQVCVVAVLAVFLMRTERAPSTDAASFDAPYRTLSATSSPIPSNDTMLVVFDPRLTDAQLRELLGANHARIVDGPNAAGAFLVAAPQGQAELVRNALRASPGVAMAELLAPPPAARETR